MRRAAREGGIMNVQKETAIALASLGWRSTAASAISVVLAVSLVICAPAARAESWGEVVLHAFECTDGADPQGLIQGRDGNFFGTTSAGGANERGTVFKLTVAGQLTTLYSFCSKANCADGAYPQAGVIQGSDGNFYGITAGGGAPNPNLVKDGPGTVFKITPAGSLTTLYTFTGGADGASSGTGLIQGSDGNFYGTT